MKVFIFTWNTQTVQYNIDNADFVSVLGDKINNSDCDLVAIGLQEDSIRDSPLLLIEKAITTNYELIEHTFLSGWGVTTYKAMKDEWDYRPRGVRLAIYKRRDSDTDILKVESKEMVCPGVKDWITAGKGGVVITLETSKGKISFLNMHLPFNSRSLIQDSATKICKRHDALMWQAKCMRKLYDDTIEAFNPDYLFLMGDLNFRVRIRTESGAEELAQKILYSNSLAEFVEEADELRLLIDYSRDQCPIVPILNEGIDNKGPLFLPTCKLWHKRDASIYNINSYRLGCENQRTPSWCDRILYETRNENSGVSCLMYDRWDYGAMNKSDHAAVVGVYKMA